MPFPFSRIASTLPRTLFGQILAAIVIGIVVIESLVIYFALNEQDRIIHRLLGTYAAQRIATTAKILDALPVSERSRFAHDLSVGPTRIRVDQPWQTSAADANDLQVLFAQALARELPAATEFQVISVGKAPIKVNADDRPCVEEDAGTTSDTNHHKCIRTLTGLRATSQVRLHNNGVLSIEQYFRLQNQDDLLAGFALPVVFGALVALLSACIIRQLTQPLSTLAQAARTLGKNLEPAAVPETGPIEIRQAAQAFNVMQKELKSLLETRAQALAGVSHDLRLPITRMRLRLEHVEQAELRHQIDGDLAEMEQMIGNTMEFLRAGRSAEPAMKIDLDALLDAIIDDMETLGVRVRLQGRVVSPLWAQPQALRRCLGNLLENARRYAGGDIDLTVQETATLVSIQIADRGPGIPESERERVFEPYVRLETSRAKHSGGSGLGLAIARAIARQHGGDVQLATHDQGGLLVHVTLAKAREQSLQTQT